MRTKQELTAETQRRGDQRGEAKRRKARPESAEEAEDTEKTRHGSGIPRATSGAPSGSTALLLAALFCWTATAAVVDRVAVVVGKIVITESEVLQEVRLTGFLNNQPLDLGPQQRRDAAERLVDQQLIRNEMEIGRYPEPSPSEAQAVLRKFRQEHYPSITEFQAALKQYGITEEQLQQHLIWQLEAIHFTDLRFPPGTPASPVETANPSQGGMGTGRGAGVEPSTSAHRAAPSNGAERADLSSLGAPPVSVQASLDPQAGTVDQQLDAWLKEARGQVRIQFKKEAFQ